jgi:beta-aspartyl-peptidase (threonine type)
MSMVLVHAGAGNHEVLSHGELLTRAALEGKRAMAEGPEAAVVAAIEVMEDAPETNAGTGSSLNLRGEVEMDAALMIPGDFGAVAAVREIRHPIRLAWAVLRDSGHKLLVGEGAREFARALGFAPHNPRTPRRQEDWERAIQRLKGGERLDWEFSLAIRQGVIERYGLGDTVGALALCDDGRLAAGASTGGLFMKLPGRAGDSPLPGAGFWCTEEVAITCTGYGEAFMRTLCARRAEEIYREGRDLPGAVERALQELWEKTRGRGGILALSRSGERAAVYNAATLPLGAVVDSRVDRDFLPKRLPH